MDNHQTQKSRRGSSPPPSRSEEVVREGEKATTPATVQSGSADDTSSAFSPSTSIPHDPEDADGVHHDEGGEGG